MKGIIVQNLSKLFLVVAALAAAFSGCGWSQKSQITRLQDEKRQLVERVGYEVKQKQQLESQNTQLLVRVSQAERELAEFVAKGNTGVSTGTAIAKLTGAPPATASTGGEASGAAAPAQVSAAAASMMLKTLEARYADIQFDTDRGAFRYGGPLTFEQAAVELPDAGKAKLDQLAALLAATGTAGKVHLLIAASAEPGEAKSSGTAATGDLGISAKRAAQVASYLRLRGVPESTISALSYTAGEPGSAGVQVFLTPGSAAATALRSSVQPQTTSPR